MDNLKEKRLTPLMKQFFQIKRDHKDTLLLFQVGDFYELFFDDAKKAAAYLGITLTKRGTYDEKPIPLCGVPVHTLDHYLTKLVRGGFKVAICDQLEEATPGKVVRRGVTQVLTPGTLTSSELLNDKVASYFFSFFPTENQWGLLFGELLTAQLFATVLPVSSNKLLESELVKFFPDEILLPNTKLGKSFQTIFKRMGYFTTVEYVDLESSDSFNSVDNWFKQQKFNAEVKRNIFKNKSLSYAFQNFYYYLLKTQSAALEQFHSVNFYQPDDFLMLDPSTQKNLELIKNCSDGGRKNTLFSIVDRATTSMGSRMIRKWLTRPLVKKIAIEQRQDVVQIFVENISLNQKTKELLSSIGDVERIVGRIALSRGLLNDYLGLKHALSILPVLQKLLYGQNVFLLKIICERLGSFELIYNLLSSSLNDDSLKDWIIKEGFDEKLDRLRGFIGSSNKKILELEKKEKALTGINSLKIRYNKVHGYYIEVTKPNAHLVPDRYTRQQTLVGRERFTTIELRELQDEIFRATGNISFVEKDLFEGVKRTVLEYIGCLRKAAHALAHLDALHGFACVAYDSGYVRPKFHDNRDIIIKQGRHPVVEQTLSSNFIPNDVELTDKQSLWIITGPNMGGKSTFLRQVALISVMAQSGSFVSAKSADLPLIDRIFTRIGSGDNLAGGKSTFLVEMEETALICKHATQNSLVILDEVGRGTSTFDGLAIAQAVVEYIFSSIKARSLFATHYHELIELKDKFDGIESFYAASKKTSNGILFLYTMIKGVADGSFGLEVAKLAGLPITIINRADEVFCGLHSDSRFSSKLNTDLYKENDNISEILFLKARIAEQDEKLDKLKKVDYNDLSPKKAFDLLWNFKEE